MRTVSYDCSCHMQARLRQAASTSESVCVCEREGEGGSRWHHTYETAATTNAQKKECARKGREAREGRREGVAPGCHKNKLQDNRLSRQGESEKSAAVHMCTSCLKLACTRTEKGG